MRVIVTRNAGIWAAGSDDSTAATARFDGSKWALTRHPELSWGVDPGAVLESADGQSLYFGAAVDLVEGSRQIGGILRLDTSKPEQWTQLAPPLAPYSVYGLGEAPDDSFWAGGFWGLRTLEKPPLGQPPSSLTGAACGVLYSRPGGQLWIGTWTQALYSYDGREWKHHSDLEGLDEMRITSILETSDQSVWVTTQRGMYRFDGVSWIRDPLPIELKPELWKEIRPAEGGLLWVNSAEEVWFRRAWPGLTGEAASGLRTTRYRPDRQEPETEITVVIDEVAQPGNTIISWRGVDPWNVTPVDRLQYSYRLNGDGWSPFTFETSRVLLALEGGRHRFEVRSRDSDFNVDPTAATLSFLVVPSIWKQGWFQVLLLTFVAILVVLGIGLLRRERQLELSNEELKAANTALESFSYSVSHDLRSPLRSIDGFSRALLDDFSDKLDTEGTGHLSKIIAASQRMARLIDGLRRLSQLTRAELNHQTVDLSELSRSIVSELSSNEVDRRWDYRIEKGLETRGDPDLLRIALTNLVTNAIKFSRQAKRPFIEIGRETNAEKGDAFFVRDNGVGFEMEYAGQLFGLFNRLHRKSEFEGDGIGWRSSIESSEGIWAESGPSGVLEKGRRFSSLSTSTGELEERPRVPIAASEAEATRQPKGGRKKSSGP